MCGSTEPQATGTLDEIGRRDHEVTSEYRIYGPPGCGKTTNLTRQIHRAVERYGPDSVLVTSFSRAAAAELAGRELPISPDRVGTLHSHCWHALGGPEIAETHVEEWNKDNPSLAITPQKEKRGLDGEVGIDDDAESERNGDEELQRLNRLRGMMLPRQFWPATALRFEKRWTEYKRANGLLDFTDLIETASRDCHIAPHNPSVIFADEAQDLNRMQLSLIRKWGERASHFIVAGDDDQASLPGSMVLVEGGVSVPVERLDPTRHRLVAYDCVHSGLSGLRKGHAFSIEPSPYSGRAVMVHVAGRATRTTHNHPWLFRWTEASRDKHIVYLMQKGGSFRVGWCKLMRSDASRHLGVRAYQEGADSAWILRVCNTRSEASLWESYVAAEYGISTALWRPMHDQSNGHYTPEVIEQLFDMLGNHESRAARCLSDFQRDVRLPFYERGKPNRYGAKTVKTAACNLIPELMAVPVVEHLSRSGVKWQAIGAIERLQYDGLSYGLAVPPHHTYVADGIVTHNCIYGFTGATPEAFLQPDIPVDHKIVLKQSYRVPRAVHRFAEALIGTVKVRQPKEYLPRPEEGALDRLSKVDTYQRAEYEILKSAAKHLERGQTVMFLASCSYMLRPIIAVLRKHGIPFHNPYRRSNGFWNPLRISSRTSTANRVLALLVGHPDYGKEHRAWTHGDLALWAELLEARNTLLHGVKAKLKTGNPTQPVTMGHLAEIFDPEALESLMTAWDGGSAPLLEWWGARLVRDARNRAEFPIEVARRRGSRGLLEEPQVVVGTIHSVKGGERDVVYLFPDLSQAGDAQYARGGAPRDSVVRQFYVGATRAREHLYICGRASQMAIPL